MAKSLKLFIVLPVNLKLFDELIKRVHTKLAGLQLTCFQVV